MALHRRRRHHHRRRWVLELVWAWGRSHLVSHRVRLFLGKKRMVWGYLKMTCCCHRTMMLVLKKMLSFFLLNLFWNPYHPLTLRVFPLRLQYLSLLFLPSQCRRWYRLLFLLLRQQVVLLAFLLTLRRRPVFGVVQVGLEVLQFSLPLCHLRQTSEWQPLRCQLQLLLHLR